MVRAVALVVFGYVEADEPGFALAHVRVCLLQGRLPVAQRLHLCPAEDEARLQAIEQVVLVPRAPVVDDELLGHAAKCRVGHVELTLAQLREAGSSLLPGTLGVQGDEGADGIAHGHLDVADKHLAPNGYLHAAAVIALADTACGYGCILSLPEG